ncbi:hypothetical protein H8959_004260 [Pygathrix nigripes]
MTLSGTFLRSRDRVHSPSGGSGSALSTVGTLLIRLSGQSPPGEASAAEENGMGWVGPALQHLRGSDLGRTSKARGVRQQSR